MMGDGGTRRYLESLLGKTAYVLLASGDGDAWFREAQVRLREMLGAGYVSLTAVSLRY